MLAADVHIKQVLVCSYDYKTNIFDCYCSYVTLGNHQSAASALGMTSENFQRSVCMRHIKKKTMHFPSQTYLFLKIIIVI